MISQGFNKVLISGKIEELGKYIHKNGKEVSSIKDARNLKLFTTKVRTVTVWKNKNTQEVESHKQIYNVCFYNELADKANKILKENMDVWVPCSLRTKTWTDKNLNDRYRMEFTADELHANEGAKPGCPNCPCPSCLNTNFIAEDYGNK
jgi:single-stranded DNA-binding protein